jgi:hypothetical protein
MPPALRQELEATLMLPLVAMLPLVDSALTESSPLA